MDVSDGEKSNSDASNGAVFAVLWGLATALGCLSTEVIMKHNHPATGSSGMVQSFFLQSMILCSFNSVLSLVVWAVDVTINEQEKDIFHGWDYRTCGVIAANVRSAFSPPCHNAYMFAGRFSIRVLFRKQENCCMPIASQLFGIPQRKNPVVRGTVHYTVVWTKISHEVLIYSVWSFLHSEQHP